MNPRWRAHVLLVLALWLAPTAVSAQRLGAVSAAVHGGGGGGGGWHASRSHSGSRRRYGQQDYDGYGLDVPAHELPPWQLLRYPYYLGYVGVRVRQNELVVDRHFEPPTVIGIVDASAGYVFDGVVRGQLSGAIDVAFFRFEARYGAYFEQTPDNIRALGLGRLALELAFTREATVQFRAGLALPIYHDAIGVEAGLAALAELDLFPVQPLVIRAEVSGGLLGRAATLDARATLGLQIESGELYVGYQVFAVSAFGPIITLHGPIAGVRVWIS